MVDADAEPPGEVDRLFGLVRERYGSRLSAAELEEVRKGVEAIVQMVQVLRAIKLQNFDEPLPPFVPYRSDP